MNGRNETTKKYIGTKKTANISKINWKYKEKTNRKSISSYKENEKEDKRKARIHE